MDKIPEDYFLSFEVPLYFGTVSRFDVYLYGLLVGE